MPKFKYTGFTADGKKVENSIDADTIKDAKKILRRQNIRTTKITAPAFFEMDLAEFMMEKGLSRPFGRADLMRFTRQLSILINAGVPILECMEILHKQEANAVLKRVIKNISMQIEEGKSLYDAMSTQVGFDKLYCALVKAGEAAGILDTILVKLAEFLEKAEKLKKQVKGALTYPIIVVFVGIVVIFGLMTFVVPQFVGILKETNQEIPWVTQVVMDISNFFQNYTLLLIAGIVAFSMFFINYIKTKEGKAQWDIFTMKAPLFGGLVIKGNLGAFTRTLATMLAAGVPIIDSLEICIDTLDNTQIAKDLTKVRKAVIEGKSITEPLSRITYFPPLVTQMIKVGESTGNLDQMLIKVADVFEEEVEDLVANLTKMIEPLILVVLGGIIGFVLIAMYLPIFMSAGGAE
ncbi:MAG TPA: type II secretion system F family protein [Bacteriovoracaceae bacterium]|nr:type II secretion system F family protein [Bacteriovoracaceae bacterium]